MPIYPFHGLKENERQTRLTFDYGFARPVDVPVPENKGRDKRFYDTLEWIDPDQK